MRLIDADALLEALGDAEYDVNGGMYGDDGYSYGFLYDFIKKQSTIDPVKHGHWIHSDAVTDDGFKTQHTRCSECNHAGVSIWKSCPYCTALMDENDKAD